MDILIIYDNTGYIISARTGTPPLYEPQGIPFIWAEIPIGKRIKLTNGIGVDVRVTPNVAILEDIPLTEIETVQESVIDVQMAIAQMIGM